MELNHLPSVPKTDALPNELRETYRDVLPQLLDMVLPYQIQHTSCLSPCRYLTMLWDHVPFDPYSVALPVALGCKPQTNRTIRYEYTVDVFACKVWIASPLCPHRWPGHILSDLATSSCLPRVSTMDPFGYHRTCMDGSLA